MRPGDRLVCILLDPQPVEYTFKKWPLHITIVPWFRMDQSSALLAEELKEHYIGAQPFTITVGSEAKFGYKKQKLVNLVSAPMLMRIEGQTRRLLHQYKAWIVDEADETRNFRPHITAQEGEQAKEGSSINCDRACIISQQGGYKRIEAEIIL
ncbi:MAG TPA: 2'-5' RNA ligase family protein [Candidatus Saccharimonadales bacterium]|nr:2'-5' RNA ligase family protein [Candidatus Saccharimonadales bacterium]